MLKEPYTEKFYTYHSKYISNMLALRPPQHESLEIFALRYQDCKNVIQEWKFLSPKAFLLMDFCI